MKVVHFRYSGRFAHFLRAEANASAPSYPAPPRTVLMGLTGAILGIDKDKPQELLAEARFAVKGKIPLTHWHLANLRKHPPAPLPDKVKATTKGNSHNEKNTIINQEWLINPCYYIWTALPDAFHHEFVERLKHRAWHFTPCLGLSEMIADLEYLNENEGSQLPRGTHLVSSLVRQDSGNIDMDQAAQQNLSLKLLRLPYSVSSDRIFIHAAYWIERECRPVPLQTDHAWKSGEDRFVFL